MKDKMTWEQTIKYIRTRPEYQFLVEKAYFEEDLVLNVERFTKSDEFIETLRLIKQYAPNAKSILDIGSGNGISSIAFALQGFEVKIIEPDPSETIGTGAIRKLITHYELDKITIFEAFAEDIAFEKESFDVVYARQCMHHAHNLNKFIQEGSRVLKRKGLFITIRDHVVFDENDKKWFLENHPLQKYYGGENAFTPQEYQLQMKNAGLKIEKEIKYFDNTINYFPYSKEEIANMYNLKQEKALLTLKKKIGLFSVLPFLRKMYFNRIGLYKRAIYDESKVPGRMYSYIAVKK
ncbi:class I SAM-dependent methyltransferase [Flavobacterium sp.]|uniref:class I SAM-dependent methyltransferase n=1 Tax=Flavobacterium sp. TaxID=239 RepID=UPI00286B58B4|nr:class I SAM-dependent methyltransferase [Flavobacterium sp.]